MGTGVSVCLLRLVPQYCLWTDVSVCLYCGDGVSVVTNTGLWGLMCPDVSGD